MRRGLVLLLLLSSLAAAGAADLPPLFRLPTGGRPLAPPVLDSSLRPASIWFLSEDRFLYLLSEEGRLLQKSELASPDPWLALDAFGRALVLVRGEDGRRLEAVTRRGGRAWSLLLEGLIPGAEEIDALVSGPDGRLLVGAGKSLVCLTPTGRRLWSAELPARPSCQPVLDALGNFLLGLADGRILSLSPYGRIVGEYGERGGAAATALAAFGAPGPLPTSPGAAGEGTDAPGGAGDSKSPRVVVALAGFADGRLALLPAPSPSGGTTGVLDLGRGGTGRAPRAIAGDEGFVAILDGGGGLLALDGGGKRLWEVRTGVGDGSLFVGRERTVVTGPGRALSYARDGELWREASIRNAVSAGFVAPSGLLFSAGADWILAAYGFESAIGKAERPVPEACRADQGAVDFLSLYDPGAASEEIQLALVRDIEERMRSGGMGGEEAGDRGILAAVARGELGESASPSQERFRLLPRARVEACRVLGLVGSPDSIAGLADLARTTRDETLRAAAISAIASIGVDPRGEAQAAFAELAGRDRLDAQSALALVAAVEALAMNSGAPPPVEAARTLLALSAPVHGNLVRRTAAEALARLARGE